MNKKDKIAILIGLIIIILTIASYIFVVKRGNSKIQKVNNNYNLNENNKTTQENNKDNSSTTSTQNESDTKMKKVAQNELTGEKEKVIVIVKDSSNGNEYSITNKDLELFKILASDENDTEESIKEKAIEYKIYAEGAKDLGITISKERSKYIEEMVESDELSNLIPNNKNARETFKKRINNYLLELEYKSALNSKILNEIKENNISINDQNLNNKMKQYVKINEDFKKIKNPTEEERKRCLQENFTLGNEIENLYLKIIKDKFIVEYK